MLKTSMQGHSLNLHARQLKKPGPPLTRLSKFFYSFNPTAAFLTETRTGLMLGGLAVHQLDCFIDPTARVVALALLVGF